ncbi:hypothetical protein HDU77_008743 [Chytriomyces hyalinus]|nr:hypothetical protein HDU77_008743 [Chytriomyces hyalinus]
MSVQEFIGQQVTQRPPVKINSASIDEFREAIVSMAKPHVFRKIVAPFLDNDPFKYAPKLPPDVSPTDMEPFLLFKSTKNSKKSLRLLEINTTLLAKWSTETVTLCVQKFGNGMDKLDLFRKAKRALFPPDKTDQSGAVQTTVVLNVIERLKAIHSTRYTASNVSYPLWANWITSQPGHMQDKLMEDCPSKVLVQHFDHAVTDPAVHN